MKKVALILLALTGLISCKDDAPKTQQLLVNPNVESGNINPNLWGSAGSGGVINHEWSSSEAYSPTRSLKISNDVSDADNFWYWYQLYEGVMPKGKDLVLNVKIKGKNITGKGISIAIRADRPSNTSQFSTTEGKQLISGTFDWTEYTVRLNSVADDANKIFVFLIYLPENTGEVYFDDINLLVQ